MLKCTKRGRKHFRHFQLSGDMKKLTWKSPAKDNTEASSMFTALHLFFFTPIPIHWREVIIVIFFIIIIFSLGT